MKKICDIISKKLTWKDILKYDKLFLNNPIYLHQLKRFLDEKNITSKEEHRIK